MPLCMVCDELTDVPFAEDGVARCAGCGTDAGRRAALPLFIVCGAMGSGKTTLVEPLRMALPDCVVFDCDLLLGHFDGDWNRFWGAWLLVAWSIAEQGRAVILCNAMPPWDIKKLPERRWWSDVHYINLDVADEQRCQRLRSRPAWRNSSSEAFIAETLHYATVLRERVEMTVDTTDASPELSAAEIAAFVRGRLAAGPG